jgi:uncharacterized protein YkwD
MLKRAIVCSSGLLLISAFGFVRAFAAESRELVTLINQYRSASQTCAGRRTEPLEPLAVEPRLERVQLAAGFRLHDAVKKAGYQAGRVQAIVLSGPANAASAMALLRERYCEALSSPQFAEVGISRDANSWRLVFAQPLLSPELGDWADAGKHVLALVNEARRAPRTCGERHFGAAQPVAWNTKLGATALAHSRDMANRNYFQHTGKDGGSVRDRARAQGYAGRRLGENIATGQGSPRQVVSGWLSSPSHCANIMEAAFTEMGAAYFVNPRSDTTVYWTQVFGTRTR